MLPPPSERGADGKVESAANDDRGHFIVIKVHRNNTGTAIVVNVKDESEEQKAIDGRGRRDIHSERRRGRQR